MVGKLVVVGVSLILVVGVIIGIVAGVTRSNNSGQNVSDTTTSTSRKTVEVICAPTDYKENCINSLSSYANNASATPKDLLMAAINATIAEVRTAYEMSATFKHATNNATQKMAMDDCKDLMEFAIDELQASYSMVGDSNLHTVDQRAAEIKNWLSAVISYQQTCLDGVSEPLLKNGMDRGMLNATRLTSNALAIVTELSDVLKNLDLKDFHLPTDVSSPKRRLLDNTEVDEGGYPTWFSAGDRRLLQQQNYGRVRPNAVVAKDGSGQYKTIAAALAAYPKKHRGRYVVYVKAGIYNEYITVTKDQVNVFMYGDGPRKTIVTGRKNNRDGISTFQTASFSAVGRGFICKSMGFQNTAGPEGHQAVALRVQSDMSAFFNCRMDGYQDTLYVQTHRQFYRNCVISGTVDFIFGDSTTVIQNSKIIVRRPMESQQNTITAHGRSDKRETTGLVIQNCRIVPEQKLFPVRFKIPSFLGRPWKEYARTVVMESVIGDLIKPAGWMPWAGDFALNTLFYAEYANSGPGARTNRRVRWRGYKVITNRREALQFTAGPFIQGNLWLRYTGVPYLIGLRR